MSALHNFAYRAGVLLVLAATLPACATRSLHPSRTPTAETQETRQITGYNFDWDDNIAFMPTKIVLFDKSSGKEREVTTAEFAEIREHIGKSGEWAEYELRGDPQTGSFRYFRDPANGTNNFLNDLKIVLDAPSIAGARPKWQGPSWNAFVTAMTHAETAQWTTIITARGHSGEKMFEAMKLLQERGLIKYVPPAANLYGVSNPKFSGSAANPSEIKTVVMKQILDRVQSRPLNDDMVDVLGSDGKTARKMHLWGFSDDDFGNYSAALKTLSEGMKPSKEYPRGRWPDVKIALFFTGKNNPKEKARVVVLTQDGGSRSYGPGELKEAHKILCTQLGQNLLVKP